VTFDIPPLNIFGPSTLPQLDAVISALDDDADAKVVVFDSAVDGFFLTHYDFRAPLEESTNYLAGATGLQALPDMLVRLSRATDVNSLPPDHEIAPEWDAFLAALGRPAAQRRIQELVARGFHDPGDVETRLGHHVGRLGDA
jgi:hypothetical protein